MDFGKQYFRHPLRSPGFLAWAVNSLFLEVCCRNKRYPKKPGPVSWNPSLQRGKASIASPVVVCYADQEFRPVQKCLEQRPCEELFVADDDGHTLPVYSQD